MPVVLAGGGVGGCGAGLGGEAVPVGDAGDVVDVGQDPCRDHAADAVVVLSRESRASTMALSAAGLP